ncbi:MAG: hypothetical protein ABI612_22665 [Betaproteobacteria bacterium]
MIFNRTKKGEFARKRKPLTKTAKRILVGVMVVCFSTAIGGSWAEREGFFKKELHVVNFAEASEIVLMRDGTSTIDEMKTDVLDRLTKCENPNEKPIVFDTNGIASIGAYQWQPHSFQHYWQKMTGEKLSEKDAVLYALDNEKARELASWVIFETDTGVDKDWVNCSKWHGLQTLVDFINSHDE